MTLKEDCEVRDCSTCARAVRPFDYCIPKGKMGWWALIKVLLVGCDKYWRA